MIAALRKRHDVKVRQHGIIRCPTGMLQPGGLSCLGRELLFSAIRSLQ